LAVAMLVLAVYVFATSRQLDVDLCAAMGIAGGLAIVVVALPNNGKKEGP
jgi:hypothetical protein